MKFSCTNSRRIRLIKQKVQNYQVTIHLHQQQLQPTLRLIWFSINLLQLRIRHKHFKPLKATFKVRVLLRISWLTSRKTQLRWLKTTTTTQETLSKQTARNPVRTAPAPQTKRVSPFSSKVTAVRIRKIREKAFPQKKP